MRTLIASLIVLIFGIVLAVACEEVQPLNDKSVAPDTMLVGPIWQLIAFVEAGGDQIRVESLPKWGRGYTVEFRQQTSDECSITKEPKGDRCMRAQGQPNEGWFTYDLNTEEESLKIYFHGQTQVGTPSGAKEVEFFNALRAAKNYRINGKQLRIFYSDGNTLIFEPRESGEE